MSIVKTKREKGLLCWVGLTVLSLGIACWFLGKFSLEWYRYHQFSSETTATIQAWGINEVKKGHYSIYAKYWFENDGETVLGRTNFKLKFTNEAAAKTTLNDWKRQSWTVYYRPKNPQASTLQRPFPMKEMVHGLIALGVLLYFLYLRKYVISFNLPQRQEPGS